MHESFGPANEPGRGAVVMISTSMGWYISMITLPPTVWHDDLPAESGDLVTGRPGNRARGDLRRAWAHLRRETMRPLR
jgi:hypothetical protein